MDPTTFMQLMGQLPQFGQMGRHPNQGQMPPLNQMPMQPGQMQQPGQGQLPSMMPPQGGQGLPGQDQPQHHGHGGFNPMMLMGLIPGLLSGGGGLGSLAPLFGMAGMFGRKLFK